MSIIFSKSDALSELKQWGIDNLAYQKQLLNLKTDGPEPEPLQICWDIYNNLILSSTREKKYSQLSRLYYSMALLSDRTNNQKTRKYLELSQYWNLISFQKSGLFSVGYRSVRISAASNSCQACQFQDSQIYTVQEALEKMPLPHKECSYTLNEQPGFCRCEYELLQSAENKVELERIPANSQKKQGCLSSVLQAPFRFIAWLFSKERRKITITLLASILFFCCFCVFISLLMDYLGLLK